MAGWALRRDLLNRLRAAGAISGVPQFGRQRGDSAVGWEVGCIEVAVARESLAGCVVVQITGCLALGRLDRDRVALA